MRLFAKISIVVYLLLIIFASGQTCAGQKPIAYWPMDEGKGLTVIDKVYGISGFVDNALWTDGIKDTGFQFDGKKAHVMVGPHKIFSPQGQKTVEFWAKPGKSCLWGVPIAYSAPKPSFYSSWNKSRWLAYFRKGDLQFHLVDNNIIGYGVSGVFTYIPEQWYYIVATWNTNGGTLKLYVNGKFIGEGEKIPAAAPWKNTDKHQLAIGRCGGADTNHFPGIVDEVLIYDRELSAEEIYNRYFKYRRRTD